MEHKQTGTYECEACGKSFGSERELQQHKKSCSGGRAGK